MDLSVDFCLSLTRNLLHILHSHAIENMFSKLASISELQELRCTVASIMDLLDAASRGKLFYGAREWIELLRDKLYDVSDELDTLCTFYYRRQLKAVKKRSGKMPPFSRFGQVAQGIQKMKMDLEAVTNKRLSAGVDVSFQRPTETSSFVHCANIVGRKDDFKKIEQMLFDDRKPRRTTILSIVGMVGLGKTALAQLLFNDYDLHFFDMKIWVCVSDQGSRSLDLEGILLKILCSITDEKCRVGNIDCLQQNCKNKLYGKKFLLVLDDMSIECRSEWLRLEQILICHHAESVIVVTTRSKKTAKIIGSDYIHELCPLSFKDSCQLLSNYAFGEVKDKFRLSMLDEICKDIFESCEGVPIAFKLVGSMLFGQDKSYWQSFHDEWHKVRKFDNVMMQYLKLGYDMLASPLKSCFVYCGIFPKNFVLKKDKMIGLWMAQGFIVPQGNLSEQQVGEEYFFTLYERCFFKDVEMNEIGEIISGRLHNLMHDLARALGGKEICVVNSVSGNFKKFRHVFLDKELYKESCFTKSEICAYRQAGRSHHEFSMDALLAKWKCLWVLDLNASGIKSLPAALGKLLHLRYLDLSENHVLEKLPKSITKLHNLQTLKLRWCVRLKKLPKNLSKLVNLRVLDVAGCKELAYIPSGIDKLTCLQSLTMFVVAKVNSKSQKSVSHLEDIKPLKNLNGHLTIQFPKNCAHVKVKGGGYLSDKRSLKAVSLMWEDVGNDERADHDEILLKSLQPHPNVRGLKLYAYCGRKIWSLFGEDNAGVLTNLVDIHLQNCHGLIHLPSLRELYHLRSLRLEFLMNLEWMEYSPPSNSGAAEILSLCSLKTLQLLCLPKLQGWCSPADSDCQLDNKWPHFPSLSQLTIEDCCHMDSFPSFSNVEEVRLRRLGEGYKKGKPVNASYSSSTVSLKRVVNIDNISYLEMLFPDYAFSSLTVMEICFDQNLERLSEISNVFRSCSSSLHSLTIVGCKNLKSLSGAIEELEALESLILKRVHNLDITDGSKWSYLQRSLRFLELVTCSKLVELPKWLQHCINLQHLHICNINLETIPEWINSLSSLQSLRIGWCKKLKSLPDAFQLLTSLKEFEILSCSRRLMERCQKPNGEDWKKIQHIPLVTVLGRI